MNEDLISMTDDELFCALREQVNISRSDPRGIYNRERVRAIGVEMRRRNIKEVMP